MNTTPRIAIVGGGPGGLTLARILQANGIDAVVYERESADAAHGQGGALYLHPEYGLHALREAGLENDFWAQARPRGLDMKILGKDATVRPQDVTPEGDTGRPEIDRHALRAMLLDGLAPGSVRWGHSLATVTALGGGRHELHFEGGAVESCDLLVGADGIWSRVRPTLTEAEPVYAGISCIEIGVPEAHRTQPALAAVVGSGNMFALQEDKGMMAQRAADGRLRIHIAFRVPEDWLTTNGIPCDRPERARAAILEHFTDWAPQLTDLVRHCDDTMVPRRLYGLPTGTSWPTTPGRTLLGDAAHGMVSFCWGVNLAMRDAADLARAVIGAGDDLTAAIAGYEKTMRERAAAMAKELEEIPDEGTDPHGVRNLGDFFRRMAAHGRRGSRPVSSAERSLPPVVADRPARIDLNLLVPLSALLSERSVTRAAERVSVSQPAMSTALAKLRRHYNDPLLVRAGQAMVLTPLAESLVDPVKELLGGMYGVLDRTEEFDPATSTRTFNLVADDYVAIVMLRPLLSKLSEVAPDVRVSVTGVHTGMFDRLRRGQSDLLIWPPNVLAGELTSFSRGDLPPDELVAVVDGDHPDVGPSMSREELAELPGIGIGSQATPMSEFTFGEGGLSGRTVAMSDTFVGAACLVSGTRMVAVIPRRLFERLGHAMGLRAVPLEPVGELTEAMYWDPRHTADPAHRWLRERIQEMAARL
ncbi:MULTISPECIES: FAD-dependent monooxygenase [Streptomyces violaceusniger group]|uniref:Flavin-dependent monooxygenase n=2 Tax=Streptomyces rhizosphaericus TaxID=114699 RepID=A0ABP4BW19_9ACTN|nr:MULTISPECIES: FAD-dependent monooxygenase [Streptomyces violaceusniger group]